MNGDYQLELNSMGYTVALTGGVGSGKSTVADAFSQLGISIIDADIIARQVVEPGTPALKAIAEHFAGWFINSDGILNRRALSEHIFSSPADKAWLNALLHPMIHWETQRQMAVALSPYVLWVVPLLVENQLHENADRVLVVDVVPEKQIQRTMQRDHVSRLHAKRILSSQATREARLAVANDVIDNNGAPDVIASEVAYLHAQYLQFAAQTVSQKKL